MDKYLEQYQQKMIAVEDFKASTLDSIVTNIKVIAVNPVHIGNMVYYYVNHNGKDVPAYCYYNDYKQGNTTFLPIYDSENTGEFGWTDFSECCRIFDVIRDRLTDHSYTTFRPDELAV
jgi:hypothetical protein